MAWGSREEGDGGVLWLRVCSVLFALVEGGEGEFSLRGVGWLMIRRKKREQKRRSSAQEEGEKRTPIGPFEGSVKRRSIKLRPCAAFCAMSKYFGDKLADLAVSKNELP